jgi:hypothetical protein
VDVSCSRCGHPLHGPGRTPSCAQVGGEHWAALSWTVTGAVSARLTLSAGPTESAGSREDVVALSLAAAGAALYQLKARRYSSDLTMIPCLLAFLAATALLLSLHVVPIHSAFLRGVLPSSSEYKTSYEHVRGTPYTVSYDERAIIVNGERVLLLSGSIHYPRFAPGEWAHQFNLSRLSGLNTVQTYVSVAPSDITPPVQAGPHSCRRLTSPPPPSLLSPASGTVRHGSACIPAPVSVLHAALTACAACLLVAADHEPVRRQYDFESESRNLAQFLQLAADFGLYVYLRIGPFVCSEWTVSTELHTAACHALITADADLLLALCGCDLSTAAFRSGCVKTGAPCTARMTRAGSTR